MRKLTTQLYRFEELSPEAQRKALDHERKSQYSCVKEMVEIYIAQELKKAGLKFDSMEIYFETCQASVTISADGPQSEKQQKILNATMATVKDEIPQLLDDEHMRRNIDASKRMFLEDGALWLYPR